MKRIFISYRRNDFYDTTRLAKVLRTEFGPNIIFFDTQSLRPGDEWPGEIKNALLRAAVMLVIIGPKWLHIQDAQSGKRRIDMPTDWVRNEIITFLERKKNMPELAMIPVLVNGAKIPDKQFLDRALAPLCGLQCINVPNTGQTSDFDCIRRELKKRGLIAVSAPLVNTPRTMPLPEQLEQEDEDAFLSHYSNWMIVESEKPGESGDFIRELYRLYEFANYKEAWRFMAEVNKQVIRTCNHHPRWQNTWNRVEFWLSTFNISHKPTRRDVVFAKAVEAIWKEEFKPKEPFAEVLNEA